MEKKTWSIWVALALLSVPAVAAAAPPQIAVSLSSRALQLGESALLSVTVSGDDAGSPELPTTPGLDVTPLGTSEQMSIINGVVDRSVTRRYQVRATRAGHYTIAPVRVPGAASRPLELDVTPAAPGLSPPPPTSPAPPRTSSTIVRGPPGRRAFLRVRVPEEQLVVGQTVPFTIRALVKAGTSGTIQGRPQLGTDAFLVEGLEAEPAQGRTEIRGTPYATLTWRGQLTALLPGEHEVAAELPATLEWRDVVREEAPERRGLSSLFDSFFNDPFFAGSPFGGGTLGGSMGAFSTMRLGRSHSAEVTLEDAAGSIIVSAPPVEGRPAGYDGAVGRFSLSASTSAPSTRVGEPITLRLIVRGEGSLEGVEHAMLPSDVEGMRVYPVSSHTDAGSGEKVFEQAITPTEAGPLVIPALTLDYFDPEAGAYASARTEPLTVEVAPSPDGAVSSSPLGGPDVGATMSPDAGVPGTFVSSLSPRAPWMPWLFAVVMGLAVATAVMLRHRDPAAAAVRRDRRAHRRAVRATRDAMRTAAEAGDAAGYYSSAVRAVQATVAARWDMAPEAVTLAELEAAGEVPPAIRDVFERADAIAFGAAQLDEAPLEPALVESALKEYDR